MFNFLIPRKTEIFDSLVEQALIIKKSAQLLQETTRDLRNLNNDAKKLEELERKADELVHTITDDIEKTFILPLDKEDIKELAELLDDIEDQLEETTNRLSIYNIKKSNDALKNFSELVLEATGQIYKGVCLIKSNKLNSKEFFSCYRNLHQIESEGDKLHRETLKSLMANSSAAYGKGPISILKWMEIFQDLEDTLDACEDVAIIFDRLRIKYQ